MGCSRKGKWPARMLGAEEVAVLQRRSQSRVSRSSLGKALSHVEVRAWRGFGRSIEGDSEKRSMEGEDSWR